MNENNYISNCRFKNSDQEVLQNMPVGVPLVSLESRLVHCCTGHLRFIVNACNTDEEFCIPHILAYLVGDTLFIEFEFF